MDVRCPHCRQTFIAEDHRLSLRECPTCLRHYMPANPDCVRCPTCESNWAEYLSRGGVDPREAILERDKAAEIVLGPEDPGPVPEER